MGSKGRFILLLFILAVLCHSGHSLTCYSCSDVIFCNKTSVCSVNHDACMVVKTESTALYHMCWKFDDCDFRHISKALGLKKLEYHCCQKDLCNRGAAASISRNIALLLAPLLVAAWTLCL